MIKKNLQLLGGFLHFNAYLPHSASRNLSTIEALDSQRYAISVMAREITASSGIAEATGHTDIWNTVNARFSEMVLATT